MGRLGDFLEAVYGASERFNTIRASIKQWRNRDLADTARGDNWTVMGRRKATPHSPSPLERANISIWIALPGRVRIEKERRRGGMVETSLTVVNGSEWWERDHEGHVEAANGTHRSRPSLIDVERHFDHASLRKFFVALNLECTGTAQTACHDCIRVRATLRPDSRLWPHWLPKGADKYEFHAEPEHGVLLSIIARYAGRAFEFSQVTQVNFDEPLDEALFTYIPAAGEQVRPAEPIAEHLTLEAAVARMPFAVLVPARLPDPEHSQIQVMYHPRRLRAPRAYLTLMYVGGEARKSLWINQGGTPDPEADQFEWQRVNRDGWSLRISDPGAEGMRVMSLEHAGTHVMIWSDLDREQLVDLAMSLVPAPG
jgi:hypothetical protein